MKQQKKMQEEALREQKRCEKEDAEVKKRNISVEEKAKAACHVNLARSGEEKTTSCYEREVTQSDEPLVPLSPGVLFPSQVIFFYFLNHLLLEFTSVIRGRLYNIVLAKQQIT